VISELERMWKEAAAIECEVYYPDIFP